MSKLPFLFTVVWDAVITFVKDLFQDTVCGLEERRGGVFVVVFLVVHIDLELF